MRLFFLVLALFSCQIQAACEYIIYPYKSGSSGAQGTHRLSASTDGIANDWRSGGGNDAWNGLLPGLSKSVDITSNSSFQPAGTILTSSGGIPFTTYAHKGGGYDPEQVFFVVHRTPPGNSMKPGQLTAMTPWLAGMKQRMYLARI